MKTLSYGDEIENAEVGTSNLELLISDDKLSANSVNRILQNLYEDEEYNYIIIQNLIKNIYGREDGILPNILEEFKEVRILESGTGNSYFRVPFGAINVMQPHYKDAGMSHGLSYSGIEGDDEKKFVNTEYIDDGFDTYTIFNKPKLSIAKRQIADYINLDIADLDNNIKIYAKKFDNAEQLKNSFVHRVANSSEGRAEIETFGKDKGTLANGEESEENKLDQLRFPFVGYYASITENTVGAVDTSIYKANTETVNFPNLGQDTTWVVLFKGDNAFKSSESEEGVENYPVSFSFFETFDDPTKKDIGRETYLPTISTFVNTITSSKEEQINSIVSDINVSYKDYYYAEKTTVEYLNEDGIATSYPALSITSKVRYTDLTDKVRLVITTNNRVYDPNSTNAANLIKYVDEDKIYYCSPSLDGFYTKTIKAVAQDYYYDSISLLTGIFSKYSSYVVNENLSKREFALEEITDMVIPGGINYNQDENISSNEFKYFIYLNMDIDKKYDMNSYRLDKNVSTSKMFGSVLCQNLNTKFEDTDIYRYVINKDHRSKPIALFSVYVKFDKTSGKSMPFIVRQERMLPILDPSKINTRAAGLNNLFVDTNTKLQNQFYYSDEGVKDYTETRDNENFPISWEANKEQHNNTNGQTEGVVETRAIKACVSEGRNEFSDVDVENYNKVVNAGVDDIIETFAPFIYNHSQNKMTQEVISNKFGKRIKLLTDRKLRIEQKQTTSSDEKYNDLNLFELSKDGALFERHDGSVPNDDERHLSLNTYKLKNYINLTNDEQNTSTSEMKARDTGILFSAENYIDENEVDDTDFGATPDDNNNYFKIYANDNKTWIKGVSGKLTIAANKNESEKPDVVLENKPINYYDFSAVYGTFNANDEINEESVKGSNVLDNRGEPITKSSDKQENGTKYLRLQGNFIVGNEVNDNTETKMVNDVPYVAIFNADTFLKGKLNIATLNDTANEKNCSSFTIEKDKIFASNYNDFWLSGNFKNEDQISDGRYSLRLRNNEGFEFKKIKSGCSSTSSLNVASSLKLNDNEIELTYKNVNEAATESTSNNAVRHYLKLNTDNYKIYMDSDFAALYNIERQSADLKVNKFVLNTSGHSSIILKSDVKTNGNTISSETRLFTKTQETIIDADTVWIGRFKDNSSEGDGATYEYNSFGVDGSNAYKEGNVRVKGCTTLGVKGRDRYINTLNVFGATYIGAQSWSDGTVTYTNEGLATYTSSGEYIGATYDEEGTLIDMYSLFVGGTTTMRGALSVDGDTTIQGNFSVDQNTDVHGNLILNGNATLKRNLYVENGDTYFNAVGGDTTVEKNVTIKTDLVVEQNCTVDQNLTVRKNAEFNTEDPTSKTTVTNNATINNLYVTGNAYIGKAAEGEEPETICDLQIYGNTIFNSNYIGSEENAIHTEVDNNVRITGQLCNVGTTIVNGLLEIAPPSQQVFDRNVTLIEGPVINVIGGSDTGTTNISGGAISCTYVQTTSSRAKKKNIVHSEREAVKAINDIEIVDFFYKNDNKEENQRVGFIAEDTDSIFSTNNKDCMDHSNCIGMLLKAIQELSAEIEELKKNK